MSRIHTRKSTSQSQAIGHERVSPQKNQSALATFQDNRGETAMQRGLQDLVNSQTAIASSVTRQVAQRAIEGTNEETPDGISQLVEAYNLLDPQTTLSVRINTLSGVEHAIYQWLIQNKEPDLTENEVALHVRQLMDATKAERRRLVDQSIQANDHQQANNDIPIAGFNSMLPMAKQELRALWRGLIENTGKIRITETNPDKNELHNGFSLNILTEFSRLLEGEYGRQMVRDINASDKLITIEPFHLGQEGKDLEAGSVNSDGVVNLTKLEVAPQQEEQVNYPQVTITDLNESQRLTIFNQLKPTQPLQAGVKIVDGDTSTYYRFGAGSNVRITVPVELEDSSMVRDSRLADAQENEIATPVFILLGHELGHGRHMQRGTVTKDTAIPNFFTNPNDWDKYGDNQEEYVNIQGTENSLRAEHGLGARKGHGNIPYILRKQMIHQVVGWIGWFNNLGAVMQNLSGFAAINQKLTVMNNRILTEWLNPNSLAQLQKDFAAMPRQLTMFQRDYIRTHYTPMGKAEIQDLKTRIEQINFSFNWSNDRTKVINLFIDRLNAEIWQIEKHIKEGTLHIFLNELSDARLQEMNRKKVFVINRLTQQSGNHVNDLAALNQVQNCILRFTNAAWLFRG